jgi:hypothetical protein
MNSPVAILGEHPFARDAHGKPRSRIGTAFPRTNTLVTLPGIHASQRQAYLGLLNQERLRGGLQPLSKEEEHFHWNNAVDLIFEDSAILIRPEPDNMPLAFLADELLQEIVPAHQIKFLGVLNEKVREAVKQRGEWWRIAPLPKSTEEMKQMIRGSRIGLGGREIYYFSRTTGVRFLTCQQFAQLEGLDDSGLREHLLEIREFSARVNLQGCPELTFFAADPSFSKADFALHDFRNLDGSQLRAVFAALRENFCRAVKPELRQDDLENVEWRNRLVAALIGQEDELVTEEALLRLSPEFFMQIEWLPGGRIEGGELIFDALLPEADSGDDEGLERLRDEKPQKFIFNFVREYGDLEYINVGRVIGSLSRRPVFYGRRAVYIAAAKLRGSDEEMVSVIRMQKWGVREYLDQGLSLLDAMIRSEEYTEYILDRRLGCRQLGMNVPMRVTAKRISERYVPRSGQPFVIWSPYFERDYIRGIATDKLPPYCFENGEFARRCACLLGRAAAPNLIVGRCDVGGNPLFDDGDEVLLEDAQGMPVDIVVADHTGTFSDYLGELAHFAAEYAGPVNRRVAYLPHPQQFAEPYLEAFAERFSGIQEEYRKRRKAFDALFKHRPRDEAGSFAYRWEKVLARLDRTDPRELVSLIREHLLVR